MRRLSSPEFEGLVNSAINHEAKLLTLGVVAVNAPEAFSQPRIYEEVIQRQGETPVWRQGVAGPFGYCTHSLEPIGCLVETTVPGKGSRDLKAFRATEMGASAGLASVGAFAEWSLQPDNPSLQEILGKTGARSVAASRAPVNRLKLLETVILSGDEWVTYPEIDKVSGIDNPRKIIRDYFTNNQDTGIYEVETTQKEYDPIIEVTRLDLMRDRRTGFSDMVDALKSHAGSAKLEAPFTIRLSDIVGVISERNKDLKIDDIRRSVLSASKRGTRLESPLRFTDESRGNLRDESQSAVRVKPELLDTMMDFLERAESVRLGQKTNKYHETARDILGSTDSFRFLMQKAQAASPRYLSASDPERVTQLIVSAVLASDSPPSAKEIKKYIAEKGVPHSYEGVRTELEKLVGEGKLEILKPVRMPNGLLAKPAYKLS